MSRSGSNKDRKDRYTDRQDRRDKSVCKFCYHCNLCYDNIITGELNIFRLFWFVWSDLIKTYFFRF